MANLKKRPPVGYVPGESKPWTNISFRIEDELLARLRALVFAKGGRSEKESQVLHVNLALRAYLDAQARAVDGAGQCPMCDSVVEESRLEGRLLSGEEEQAVRLLLTGLRSANPNFRAFTDNLLAAVDCWQKEE